MNHFHTPAFHLLRLEEEYRGQPYLCSEGYPTVAIGQRIGPKGADLAPYQFQVPVSVAEAWLNHHIERLATSLRFHPEIQDCWLVCSPNRRAILISMAYQLGVEGLTRFKRMLAAGAREDWSTMAAEALDSRWANQTPNRAQRHAQTLEEDRLYLNDDTPFSADLVEGA